MAYEFFWISGSPYAWTALLAMEIKGLSYESRLLDRTKDEHKAPEFLAINPRGKVPVLKTEDAVVSETIAILAYLDEKHPEPPLFGTTPRDTGLIWQLISEINEYVRDPVSEGITGPIFRGNANDSEGANAVMAARGPAHKALNWVNDKLAESSYLAGDKVSATDIVLLPVIQAVTRAASKPDAATLDLEILPIEKYYPNIAAWVSRMETLPGYDNTYPPHWRE
jgi:glutathione S-transferase